MTNRQDSATESVMNVNSIAKCETVILNVRSHCYRMTNRQDSPTESVVDVKFYSYMWNHKPNNETMVLKSVFVEVSLHYTDIV